MLTFAHGNKNGSGSKLEVTMTPATEDESGYVRFIITNQAHDDATDAAGRHVFDDSDFVAADLDAKRLAHVLGVLWGDGTSILNGKGIRMTDGDDTVTFHFDAAQAPYEGFAIHITSWYQSRKTGEGRINLNCSEARALCSAIEASMGQISFGR